MSSSPIKFVSRLYLSGFGLLSLALLGGCVAGSDYNPPVYDAPAAYKFGEDPRPETLELPTEVWWQLFDDEALNALVERAVTDNPSLEAAVARVDQARAVVGLARADLLPEVDFAASVTRSRTSGSLNQFNSGTTLNRFTTAFDLTYDLDIWGRLKRARMSAEAEAEAEAMAFRSTLLALQAETAATYFQIRSIDYEMELLRETVAGRSDALRIIRNRFTNGLASERDVAQAETELALAESELLDRRRSRAFLVNALAVLTGTPASTFTLPPVEEQVAIPELDPGLPSGLLLRRPDIAEAERLIAAAAQRVGIAEVAFYPNVSLTGSAGLGTTELNDLLMSQSRIWSLSPQIEIPIFYGGRNKAELARVQAQFDELLSLYRAQILTAFQEVEDALASLQLLEEQAAKQEQAAASAMRSAEISRARFEQGVVDYFEVVETERVYLQAARTDRRIRGLRLVETVRLIEALGGGWNPDALDEAEVEVADEPYRVE